MLTSMVFVKTLVSALHVCYKVRLLTTPMISGETPTSAGCETAVSIFTIDYDAPERLALPIQKRLVDTVQGSIF